MKWNKYRLKTNTGAEDIVASILMEHGIEGVEIEDKIPLTKEDQQGMFVGIMPEIEENDGTAYLIFYLKDTKENEAILKEALCDLESMKNFCDMGELSLEQSITEDEDWINNWKSYFHQFYIDDILIIPSWETNKRDRPYKMKLEIDPGVAFGTGKHETTELAIRGIKKYLKEEDDILDLGIGSGILSLVALKLGARHALGTDLDENAINATFENMNRNAIKDEQYQVLIGDIIEDRQIKEYVNKVSYDLVVSNILAEVLIHMTPVVYDLLKSGGIYITSGIIEDKEAIVRQTIEQNQMEIIEVRRLGEWVSIVARK